MLIATGSDAGGRLYRVAGEIATAIPGTLTTPRPTMAVRCLAWTRRADTCGRSTRCWAARAPSVIGVAQGSTVNVRSNSIDASDSDWPVQSGARRHGIAGIHGNAGNVESATCRF